MAVIKNDYLFPIYCENAELFEGEKNFHATGADIVDTLEDADLYVHIVGDTMTGDLIMEGAGTGIVTNRIDTNNSNGLHITLQNDDWLQLNETVGVLYAYKPLLIDTIHGRTGTKVSFANDRIVDVEDPIDDLDVVNKRYLEEQVQSLTNKIVELEEELETIAPTIERGEWNYSSNEVPASGEYTLLSSATSTNDFSTPDVVRISTTDYNGGTHSFNNITSEDEFLQILNNDNNAYGLYQINSVTSISATTPYFEFAVTYAQSFGTPEEAINLARIKIFDPPLMDPDVYVMKTGDSMSGKLEIDKPQPSSDGNGFVIKGRIDDGNNGLMNGTLLKDYRRQSSSQYSDYVEYFGEIKTGKTIINKEYLDDIIANNPGPEGEQGEAATIRVGTTTTSASGGNAVVSNSGNQYDAIFDFTIPRGPKGEKGSKGAEVELYNTTTAPSRSRGHLLMTSDNKFYIYT